jgi:hypothetical protein
VAYPRIGDFDRSYADATPEQRDELLNDAQQLLQRAVTMPLSHRDDDLVTRLNDHESLITQLMTILTMTLTAIRYERKDIHAGKDQS